MGPFEAVDGSVNHGGREGLGGRGEAVDGLTAGDLTGRVIGLAIKVHRTVGPALLEQVYEECLCHEMARAGLMFQRQVELPLVYGGVRLPGLIGPILSSRKACSSR
jgi:PD-(D/E)XK nuclease superfamily